MEPLIKYDSGKDNENFSRKITANDHNDEDNIDRFTKFHIIGNREKNDADALGRKVAFGQAVFYRYKCI